MPRYNIVRDQLLYSNPDAGVAVFEGRILPQSWRVAIKEETHADINSANFSLGEAITMFDTGHPNICKVYDCFLEQEQGGRIRTVIVVELLDSDLGKETERRRNANEPWTDYELYYILRGLVSALSFAESKGISHRDIKPQNIFYSNGQVKVGDFGSSTLLKDTNLMYSLQGTPLYLSPELKRGYIEMLSTGERNLQYDPIKSDVYSLGMTMLTLATLAPPNQLLNLHTLEVDTQNAIASLSSFPYLQFFLTLMLKVDDQQRPSFSNLWEIITQIESQSVENPSEASEQMQESQATMENSPSVEASQPVVSYPAVELYPSVEPYHHAEQYAPALPQYPPHMHCEVVQEGRFRGQRRGRWRGAPGPAHCHPGLLHQLFAMFNHIQFCQPQPVRRCVLHRGENFRMRGSR